MIGYVFWFVLLNGSALALFAYAVHKLPAGPLKKSYLGFLLTSLLWTNLIFFVRGPTVTMASAGAASPWVFAMLTASFISLAVFLFFFSGQTAEFRHPRFFLFLGVNFFFIAATFAGGVERGVRETPYGFAPVYGPLHTPFIISNFVWGAYMFFVIYRAYRRSTNELLRYQMEILAKNALAMFLFIGLFNGVIPIATGNSTFSHIGPLGLVFFYAGVLQIILNERSMFLRKLFGRFARLPHVSRGTNASTMRQILQMLESLLSSPPAPFRRDFTIAVAGGHELSLVLSGDESGSPAIGSSGAQRLPGWVRGMIDSVSRLEADNRRLAFGLIASGGEDRGPRSLEGPFVFPPGSVDFHRYAEQIEENLQANEEVFRVPILCFSNEFQEVLAQLQRIAAAKQPTIFTGEAGTGKALLARALHGLRGGGPLVEFSMAMSPATFEEEVKKLVRSLPKKGPPHGILIRHLRKDPDMLNLIEWLDEVCDSRLQIYGTADESFSAARLIRHIPILVPPLRNRREDIFFHVVHFCTRAAVEHRTGHRGLDGDAMRDLQAAEWRGNTTEVISRAEEWVLRGKPPIIEIEDRTAPALLAGTRPGLTPLEDAEMHAIVESLEQNDRSKKATARQLGISVNTLKAKLKKYGIG